MVNPSLDPENPKEPYAIIQFEETDEKGKLCIDLVLKKWFSKRGKKNMCKYPPETSYHLRDRFLEELKTPEKLWSCVPYTFIVGAETLEQGRRRLHRAQFTKDCRTTDVESEKSVKEPSLLSKSQISNILHNELPMRSNSAHSRIDVPTAVVSKASHKKSRFNRLTSISSDTDSENKESRSTYSIPQKRSHKSCASTCQTKQSLSNREKFDVNNPKKQLCKRTKLMHTEDDTDNEFNQSCNESSTSSQTLPMKEKIKDPRDLSTADNAQLFQNLKDYIDKKLDNLRYRIGYDLKTKITDLKNTIISANLNSAAGPNLTSTKTRLSIKVPIETLEEFLSYENVLKNDKDEIEALQMFFRVLIYSQTKANSCIATIMTATLSKAVELEYSGFGRSVGGKSKRNFSVTQTCITMKEAIMAKLGEGLETENLQSKISKWLSGAKDRKGGRKER